MRQKELLDTGLLLKCPGYNRLSHIGQMVLKEALMSFLMDEADPTAEVDDQYYYGEINDTVYDEDGMIRTSLGLYNEQAYWNFIRDETGNVNRLREEVREKLTEVLSLNSDQILGAYNEVTFCTIHCPTEFPNHILFLIHGATTP